MEDFIVVGYLTMTCNKCGSTRNLNIRCPKYYHNLDVNDILSKKMIHVCDKRHSKYGIMSVTDVNLGTPGADLESILDNAYLSEIPISH